MSSVMGGINRTNSLTYLISVREDRRNAQVGAALNNRMGQVAASTNQVKNNARGAALATRNLGYVAQNASYQIADFFVMLQGGVGVFRSLSTQLPQLLAGFGTKGAIAGAAAAAFSSLFVLLSNNQKAVIDSAEAFERLTDATDFYFESLAQYISTASTASQVFRDLALYQERIASAQLAEALAPPEASAWRGVWEFIKDTGSLIAIAFNSAAAAVGRALNYVIDLIPGLRTVVNILGVFTEAIGSIPGAIGDAFRDLDAAARRTEITLSSAFSNMIGPETIGYAKRLNDLLDQYGYKALQIDWSKNTSALQEANVSLAVARRYLEEVVGVEDKWTDAQKQGIEYLEMRQEKIRDLSRQYEASIYNIADGLNRRTELDEYLDELTRKMEFLGYTAQEMGDIIKQATDIDLWQDLQDIVIDVGKTFENQIVGAMKSGKFAVKDFVEYALEQFARLALSKVFEPFFVLLANSIPGLGGGGGGGSSSPGFGRPGFQRSMDFEAPPSAAPMYNYGESIGRVPGGTRNVSQSQQANKVTVNVNNYGNDEVEVSQSNTSNGIEIDVLIKNTVKKGLSGGDFDSVMAQSFGARRLGY